MKREEMRRVMHAKCVSATVCLYVWVFVSFSSLCVSSATVFLKTKKNHKSPKKLVHMKMRPIKETFTNETSRVAKSNARVVCSRHGIPKDVSFHACGVLYFFFPGCFMGLFSYMWGFVSFFSLFCRSRFIRLVFCVFFQSVLWVSFHMCGYFERYHGTETLH